MHEQRDLHALDLAALLDHPEQVAQVPAEQIPPLLCQLAALQSMLAARLTGATTPVSEDRMLDIEAAADRTGMSKDWLYRHAKALPFTRRIGRKMLFSEAGLTRWLTTR